MRASRGSLGMQCWAVRLSACLQPFGWSASRKLLFTSGRFPSAAWPSHTAACWYTDDITQAFYFKIRTTAGTVNDLLHKGVWIYDGLQTSRAQNMFTKIRCKERDAYFWISFHWFVYNQCILSIYENFFQNSKTTFYKPKFWVIISKLRVWYLKILIYYPKLLWK